jgi:hypothetical protein
MTTRDNRLTPLFGGPLFGGVFPLVALIVLGGLRTAAPAQTAERTRWEYDGGSLWRTLTWTEQSGKTSHTYFETRRNPVFVELFDPSRQYTVRLYADKLLLRGGKGSAKTFRKFTRLSGGAWKDAGTRLEWQSPAGSLRAQNDEPNDKGEPSAAWVERNFDGTHIFHETSRRDEFIELKDPKRDYTIRLSADELKIRGGNKTVPQFAKLTRLYTGHWAPGRKPVIPKIVLDLHEAPEVARWADGAKRLCEDWYAIIYDMLYPTGQPLARRITIHFKDPIRTVAYTFAQQGEITISANWVKKHPEDIGMVIHELTHVVQNYPESKGVNIFWIGEGVADYVRYFEFEPEKPFKIDRKHTYRDGYGTAAAFLDWVERTHGPHVIEKLNARLAIGAYTEELFEDYAREPLGTLWTTFAATLHH